MQTKQTLPRAMLNAMAIDPARTVNASPGMNKEVLPHVYTVSGRTGIVSNSYLNQDEALRHSRANADRMRADCGIMECIEARQRAVALLSWSIVPEDETPDNKALASILTRIMNRTPRFVELRRNLGEAIWFGRMATNQQYGKTFIGGTWFDTIKRWSPRHGDKLVFRWDDGTGKVDPDQVGIRVGGFYPGDWHAKDPVTGEDYQRIQPTQQGLVYWFNALERRQLAVHKHHIEDGPFHDPNMSGRIHGVGIRDRIYWTWYAMIECLQRVIEYLDRAAFGIEVWPYQQGNERHQKDTERAAKNAMGGGRTVILAPLPSGESPEVYLPRIIQPGLAGINTTIEIIKEYFGHKIKRYILGQTLTSEADATGLGSGVADAHLATFADIIEYDANNLGETITREILEVLQLSNFPMSLGTWLQFKINTEADDVQGKMAAYKAAWDMGTRIKASEIYDVLGSAMPGPTDEVLFNPQIGAASPPTGQPVAGMPQPGQPGVIDLESMHRDVMNRLRNPFSTAV
jgi:phage gp29-like protein